MMRHCNGSDPNLNDGAGQPCNCGLLFDDVDRVVIWPHLPVPPVATLPPLEAMMIMLHQMDDMGIRWT